MPDNYTAHPLTAFRASQGRLYYWRDKLGHELDFVVKRGANRVDAFECLLQRMLSAGRALVRPI